MENEEDYKLIPMSEITDEARKIAVSWMECEDKNWIGQKHKLASDIMNYAKRYHASLEREKEEVITDAKNLYKAMGEWSCEAFPDSDNVGHLHKLLEETEEAINDPGNIEEYADCLLVIMAAAYRSDIAFDHLIKTAEHKLQVNKSRKWNLKENGIYQHIEEEAITPSPIMMQEYADQSQFEQSKQKATPEAEVREYHGICREENCTSIATKDYNGCDYWVCDRHYDKLSSEFDEEYK